MAALRLVHVMGGDEHGDAAARRARGSGPRTRAAPSDRRRRSARRAAAAAGRAAGRRRARAAASSRPRARRRAASRASVRPSCSSASPTRALAVGHAVDARDEVEVLLDREVLVEAEALRHVADAALDLGARVAQIEAEAGPAALVRRQQPAEHADGRRLAAAVRTEEAEMRPRGTARSIVVHHARSPKLLVRPRDVDDRGGVAHVHFERHFHRLPRMQLRRVGRRRAAPRPGRRASRGARGCRSPAACIRPAAR